MVEKKFSINAHELNLTNEQFKKVEPLADQAADYLSVNINPIAGFAIVCAFMYGNNIMMVRAERIKELPKAEQTRPIRRKSDKRKKDIEIIK